MRINLQPIYKYMNICICIYICLCIEKCSYAFKCCIYICVYIFTSSNVYVIYKTKKKI